MKILISHTYSDKKLVKRLCKELSNCSHGSIKIWHFGNVQFGTDWKEELEYRLTNAEAYIVLLTSDYMNSSFATYELGRLIQLQKTTKRPVIPITLHPLKISDTPASHIRGFRIAEDNDFKQIAYKIINAIERSIEKLFPIDCGEVYLKYEALELDVLSGIMFSIRNIYYLLYNSAESYPHRRNKIKKHDRIYLYTSETGESIKFKVKTGWVPNISTDGVDIVIESPKSVIALLASFYLLSIAVEKTTASYKNILDIIKTENEIEMQSLTREKVSFDIKKIKNELSKVPTSCQEHIDKEIHHFLRHTVHNNDVKSIRIKTRQRETEVIY